MLKNVATDGWLRILAVVMLAGVFAPLYFTAVALPYAYFQYMNWIVAIAAIVVAIEAKMTRKMWAVALFVLVAVTFNPIAPMYFSDYIWQVSDVVAIILFVLSFWFVKGQTR